MGGGDGEDNAILDLEGKLKGGLWYEQLQKFIAAQKIYSYAVPRIVCIGEESSGKSSTLERIAEVNFFPTDRRLCTRMPIELKLRHRKLEDMRETLGQEGPYVIMKLVRGSTSKLPNDLEEGPFPTTEVASKVKGWMDTIVQAENGGVMGIVDDRLIIELYSERKINLDLIDLPGMVSGHLKNEPSDIMDQTRALSEKYLQDPHTLIVVVLSNRAERIRNSQAFELIQRYKKEEQTVGVLTMVDRCADSRRPDDPYWELKERLDGTSDDLPDLGAGYVALKNRDSTIGSESESSIEASHVEEVEWFNTNLPGYKDRSCIGVGDLIHKLMTLLQTYAESTWSRMELSRLSKLQEEKKEELLTFGEPVADLSTILNSSTFSAARLAVYQFGGGVFKFIMEKVEQVAITHGLQIKGTIGQQWITANKATDPDKFYAEQNVFMKVLQNFLDTAMEEIITCRVHKVFDRLALKRDGFTRLHRGVREICREWERETIKTISSKFYAWLEATRHGPTNFNSIGVDYRKYSNIKQYILELITIRIPDGRNFLMHVTADIIISELLAHPLKDELEPPMLEKSLRAWWVSSRQNGDADDDIELNDKDEDKDENKGAITPTPPGIPSTKDNLNEDPLCREASTWRKNRVKVKEEHDALNAMVSTLLEVFPPAETETAGSGFGFGFFNTLFERKAASTTDGWTGGDGSKFEGSHSGAKFGLGSPETSRGINLKIPSTASYKSYTAVGAAAAIPSFGGASFGAAAPAATGAPSFGSIASFGATAPSFGVVPFGASPAALSFGATTLGAATGAAKPTSGSASTTPHIPSSAPKPFTFDVGGTAKRAASP